MLRFFLFVKYIQYLFWGFRGGSDGRESACNAGDMSLIPESKKGIVSHSSILSWRIPWTEEPGGIIKSQT